jgi:hypothetical protein
MGAENIQNRDAKQGRADAMAGNIEQIEGESFGIKPVITEAVPPEMRTGEITPVGLNRP